MPDEHDLLDGHGPRLHGLVEERGEATPVVRDVEAGVVAEVERRVSEVLLEPRPVRAVPEQGPGVVGLAEAVDEHRDLRRVSAAAERHLEGERIAGLRESVAHRAVQRAEREAAAQGACGGHPVARGEARQRARPRCQALVDEVVGRARHAIVHEPDGRAEHAERAKGPTRYAQVRLLDELGRAAHGCACQVPGRAHLCRQHRREVLQATRRQRNPVHCAP